MITKNQIYTYVTNYIKSIYPTIYVTAERTYAVAKFPCLQLYEVSAAPVRENIDLTDNSYRITMEVQAFTNMEQGGSDYVYNIIKHCQEAFNQIGFRMQMSNWTENTKELTIRRHVARFTRVVCSSDTIEEE